MTLATGGVAHTEFAAIDGGKTVVYMLRRVASRRAAGPWSEVTTATVAA